MSDGGNDNAGASIPEARGQRNSVEIFLTSLEKACRSARVYAYESGQQMLESIYDNVVNALDRAFFDEDEIDVQVKPLQMMFQKRIVYDNKDKKHSLAFQLHENGVRLLTFKRGLDRDELVRIIQILATDFSKEENLDSDLYCLFVENPLEHCEVIGSDVLGDAQKSDPSLKQVLSDFRKQNAAKALVKRHEAERKIRQDDMKILEEFHLSAQQFARSDEEVNKIVKGVTSTNVGSRREKETLERLALMGFHFLLNENDVDQNQVGRELIAQVARMMLEEAYVALFGSLMKKVAQLKEDRSHQRGEYQKIQDAVFSEDNLPLIRLHLENAETQKRMARILLDAPPVAVKLIIQMLDVAPWMSKVYPEFILKHSPGYTKWLGEMVQTKPELECWEPLLNILALRPNQQFTQFMSSLLESAGQTVKLKVLRQCATIGTEEALDVFRPYLRSELAAERKLVFDLLPLAKNKKAVLMIKSIVDGPDFESLDDEEKVMAYTALIRVAGASSYKWFEAEWLKQAGGLFKAKAMNEKRLRLAKAAASQAPVFIQQILEKTPVEGLGEEIQPIIRNALAKLHAEGAKNE